jgi:hypothetical protein
MIVIFVKNKFTNLIIIKYFRISSIHSLGYSDLVLGLIRISDQLEDARSTVPN